MPGTLLVAPKRGVNKVDAVSSLQSFHKSLLHAKFSKKPLYNNLDFGSWCDEKVCSRAQQCKFTRVFPKRAGSVPPRTHEAETTINLNYSFTHIILFIPHNLCLEWLYSLLYMVDETVALTGWDATSISQGGLEPWSSTPEPQKE